MEKSSSQRVAVLLPVPLSQSYDYWADTTSEPLQRGDVIQAPFGTRQLPGIVWQTFEAHETPAKPLKHITKTFPTPRIAKVNLDFCTWVAQYTLSPLGSVSKLMLSVPQALEAPRPRKNLPPAPDPNFHTVIFSDEQEAAVTQLHARLNAGFSVSVLDGVTGSGKTEVYLESVARTLETGGQALILLPEISLSPQMIDRFTHRFGVPPALWHSAMTPAQRRNTWQDIVSGAARVIVGARSALFLPYPDLRLIIVDEEHEHSFKQEEGVIYQGRDMAVARAALGEIPIVLASATPSLETLHNCTTGKYNHLMIAHRYAAASLPQIQAVDMRTSLTSGGARRWISPALHAALAQTFEAGDQALLFLNRRGYAPLTLCGDCGHRIQCPHCTTWLVEHRARGRLMCHQCGHSIKRPAACPSCGVEDQMIACGPGVERLEEEIKQTFPDVSYAVISSDAIASPQVMAETLDAIRDGKIQLIIGTQMIAKGHHFPGLTLVGVIDADLGLSGGDLRACERTYQLLHQVAGRAGRAAKAGRVFLQTYAPQHPVMQALTQGTRDAFVTQELIMREQAQMPPFGRLSALIISSLDKEAAETTARALACAAPQIPGFDVFGPAPAPIAIIRKSHRFRILVRTPRSMNLQKILRQWMQGVKAPSSVRIKVDIDPYSFL